MSQLLYCDNNEEEIPKVSLGSIRFLAAQLSDFVELYGKKVLMNEEEKELFNRLCMISQLLNDERYGMLIGDPNKVIDFNDCNEDYLPDYYPL